MLLDHPVSPRSVLTRDTIGIEELRLALKQIRAEVVVV
jgi:hypothetical protein